MIPQACHAQFHLCRLPRAPRRFTTPADAPNYQWSGRPSLAYGAVRALAYAARCKTGSYVRILYGDAGRQGDPWGGLRLEVCGLRAHFGAGMIRFPELIGPDRVLKPEGYELMARGETAGVMDFNQTDWRWVQDELDLEAYLPKLFWRDIQEVYEAYRTGKNILPKFQSHSTAAALGFPIKPDARNCTSIHAQHLQPWLLWAHMPLVFLDQVLAQGPSDGAYYTASDCVLNQLLGWSEDQIMTLLTHLHPDTNWDAVARGLTEPPTSLLFGPPT